MHLKSIYLDLLDRNRPEPKPGDVIQCIGRGGKFNTTYLVINARVMKRQTPTTIRRVTMKVINISRDEKPIGASVFELRWYSR